MLNWGIYNREQKIIFIVFGFLLAASALVSFIALRYDENLWSWISVYWVTLLSNSFIAIPHEPFYIEMGKSEPIYLLLLISIVPTIMGCMLDFIILKPLIYSKKLKKIRNHQLLTKYEGWFKKYPGLLIFIFAISPLPFYVVRILSLTTGFPFIRYALHSLSGRVPRYFLLSIFGFSFKPPFWSIILLFVILIIIPLIIKFYKTSFGKSAA